jgi:hypothetical protein
VFSPGIAGRWHTLRALYVGGARDRLDDEEIGLPRRCMEKAVF